MTDDQQKPNPDAIKITIARGMIEALTGGKP